MAKRKRYSVEFERQALKRADEPGVTDALVCEELRISARQLYAVGAMRWLSAELRRRSPAMARAEMMS